MVLLAGSAAERRHDPKARVRPGGRSDRRGAVAFARGLARSRAGSAAILRWGEAEAAGIVLEHWRTIAAFANLLLEKRVVEGAEATAFIAAAVAEERAMILRSLKQFRGQKVLPEPKPVAPEHRDPYKVKFGRPPRDVVARAALKALALGLLPARENQPTATQLRERTAAFLAGRGYGFDDALKAIDDIAEEHRR